MQNMQWKTVEGQQNKYFLSFYCQLIAIFAFNQSCFHEALFKVQFVICQLSSSPIT